MKITLLGEVITRRHAAPQFDAERINVIDVPGAQVELAAHGVTLTGSTPPVRYPWWRIVEIEE